MQNTNPQTVHRILILGFLIFVALPICIFLYSKRSNDFKNIDNTNFNTITISNPYVIKDWLPEESYKYTLARLNDYVSSNSEIGHVEEFNILGNVTNYTGTYTFSVGFLPGNEVHQVSVRVVNYSSLLSNAVYIDGTLQAPLVPKEYRGISFGGLDSLVDQGVSVFQVKGLQQALYKFSPSASEITVSGIEKARGTDTYKFSLQVNDRNYSAQFRSITDNLNSLQINDSTGQQVYSSDTVENGF